MFIWTVESIVKVFIAVIFAFAILIVAVYDAIKSLRGYKKGHVYRGRYGWSKKGRE